MPPKSRFRAATALLIAALALVAASTSASAATKPASDHSQRTATSSFDVRVEAIASGVIEGEVISQRYITTPGGAQTESIVRVGDWRRGSGPDVITVVTEGGITSTGVIHNVSHQPALDVGARLHLAVVDWATWDAGRSYSIVGGPAGAVDAETGEQVASKIITAADLLPPFVLNGDSWNYPLAAPIEFKINPNSADISGTGEAAAVNAAIASWEASSGIDFTNTGNGTLTVADPNDFINIVFWAPTPNPAHTFLAKASWYEYVSAPGEIVGFDVHFNTDHQWATNGVSTRFDVESVALHEIGHAIGLDHTTNSADSMFGSLPPGVLRRALSSADTAGAQFLYPPALTNPQPTATPLPIPTATPQPTAVPQPTPAPQPTAMPSQPQQPNCLGSVATIVGTYGDDILTGTNGRDVFVALAGNDIIYGNGGNDLVCAGSGHDTVFGGPGNDTIYGQTGADQLRGDSGRDELFGGPGYDDLQGGDGDDRLQAAGGNDTLRGGNGNDVLWGKPGNDVMHGDDGDDEIYGASGDDVSYGGTGRDSIHGAAGNDELHGGGDNDVLFGQNGHDDLFGNAGNDTIYAAAGNDLLDGGTGADNLQGGGGNDVLNGGSQNDLIYGQSGVNTVNGGTGIDQCFAGGSGSTMTAC